MQSMQNTMELKQSGNKTAMLGVARLAEEWLARNMFTKGKKWLNILPLLFYLDWPNESYDENKSYDKSMAINKIELFLVW